MVAVDMINDFHKKDKVENKGQEKGINKKEKEEDLDKELMVRKLRSTPEKSTTGAKSVEDSVEVKTSSLEDENNVLCEHPKFKNGCEARLKWKKGIIPEDCSIEEYNDKIGNKFFKRAVIQLDDSTRNTCLEIDVLENEENAWNEKVENIYIFVRDGKIMKIGGTRTGMKARWNSYLCGHCVRERKKLNGIAYPGKMSVTNAYLYHTIEDDILSNNSLWEIWCWKLPKISLITEILDEKIDLVPQVYHIYESKCMNKFKSITDHIPQFSKNCDPNYKNK